MDVNNKVGIIFYEDTKDEKGNIIRANLLFIDSVNIKSTDSENLVWIASLDDFSGNGLEVYTEPEAGGGPTPKLKATDENIRFFVNTIINEKEGDVKQKLKDWIITINTSEDLETLLPEEKERLIKIINEKII